MLWVLIRYGVNLFGFGLFIATFGDSCCCVVAACDFLVLDVYVACLLGLFRFDIVGFSFVLCLLSVQ